ncbi:MULTISPECIES: hypothetical protein [unclassified Bradyrhizobium]|uniref:hypothetical protein n=1 Tax=unclassified Bradyrhizobium TaxID=2631580 RepID=UPI00070E6B00|nr:MULTISPECIES: hypothetical protein [unclassified Bradyrhizobium]KQT05874.1 hypothetical protein ASG57_10805 [Bradyrhizobium sp. Leaf396]
MTAQAKTAKVVEDLVDYEGPQLLLLKTNRKFHMLAVAIQREGFESAFFGCEVTEKVFETYFDEIADLNFVFQRAYGKNYYFFDLSSADNGEVALQKASVDDSQKPEYWPQVGFFARSHTSPLHRSKRAGSTKTFKIDGRWGADDFSHFHGKMDDLYSLFGVIERLDPSYTNSAEENHFIRQAIKDRFWQGGGSYGGFYGSLTERSKHTNFAPLEVARIAYASPGEISLRGNKKALTDIANTIQTFDEHWEMLRGAYLNIYGVLRKEKLLSARPTKSFSSVAVRNIIRKNSSDLAIKMGIDKVDELYAVCDSNTLVFSKVVLSIFRRANELYLYYAEGRVQAAD